MFGLYLFAEPLADIIHEHVVDEFGFLPALLGGLWEVQKDVLFHFQQEGGVIPYHLGVHTQRVTDDEEEGVHDVAERGVAGVEQAVHPLDHLFFLGLIPLEVMTFHRREEKSEGPEVLSGKAFLSLVLEDIREVLDEDIVLPCGAPGVEVRPEEVPAFVDGESAEEVRLLIGRVGWVIEVVRRDEKKLSVRGGLRGVRVHDELYLLRDMHRDEGVPRYVIRTF